MGSDSLVCPYSRCGRAFEQPVLVTDGSKLPRETYYACPHCMLRLELSLNEDNRCGDLLVRAFSGEGLLESYNRVEDAKGDKRSGEGVSSVMATRPSKSCRHFLGYLRELPERAGIPDDCAVCPKIIQCYVKRE